MISYSPPESTRKVIFVLQEDYQKTELTNEINSNVYMYEKKEAISCSELCPLERLQVG